ncbi:MAG: hypothetical protein EZS28_012339 [Streblomastix strix]|uniref:Transmembrane protein n=1 Tax=Streblomastix strix TaxID=222440 RepID=A0A5J4WB40_9EUKA|nr:MAG: hypothetical protein EZS28_012339 [Streblomastix strix]
MLVLKGQGEQESLLIQKNISQTLFILQNSQLNTSYLSAQLWGAEASLIRSQGNGMSIIDGLRVIGVKQESTVVYCSVFEVISGELSLNDIHIKDINITQNYNEINSLNKRRNKMKGFIEMKENAKVLYIEKFIITNINIENINKQQRMSSIMMNAGHLKLRDGTFLGDAYTSIGSAIRIYPTGPSTIDVEGVLFKGQGDGQGTNGGAVYVDMRVFDVQMSFKRCVFIGNNADYGSNVFIRYASLSYIINKNAFIGCASIVENSYESDISVCYSIGDNDDEIFIDERNLIHSSWNRQKSEGVVRFIANSDTNHTIDSSLKCGSVSKPCNTYQTLIEFIQQEPESIDGSNGRVETLIFGEGKISSPFIDLSLAQSDIVNIVGCGDQLTEIYPQQSSFQAMIYGGFNQIIVVEKICIANSPASPLIGFIRTQGAESGLVMQDMRVQGYLETSPYNTMLEPPYLFSIEGFVHLQDVIFEHIYLRAGAILQVVGLRRIADDSRIEQLGKTSIGFYRCLFDDITSNESVIISLNEKDLASSSTLSEINKIFNNNVQNSEKTTKFVIEDTIFSDCTTSLLLSNKNEKGGLLNLKNKKVRFEILNSEYRNIAVKSRNMLYLAWGVYEPDDKQINILTITETFFTNCSALIPEMDEKVEESQITQGQQSSPQTTNQFINIQQSNELYTNGSIIFDNLYKYGLIFINNLNKEINDSINLAIIDITSLFMSNCHSAIGSALTVTRLTLNLQESQFVEPMCYGNMLYLNQTQTSITNCQFNGYNNTLPDLITEDVQSISDAFCPNNPQYFSSIEYALVYLSQGSYISNNDIYKNTRIGAIRIDSAVVELKNVQFIDPWEESSQLDGSLLMIACKGESNLNIIDPTVNQMTEENCKTKSQNSSSISNENENECQFGIVFDDICQFKLSEAFNLPPMPVPLLKSAKVVVNVNKDQDAMKFVIEGEQFVLSLFTVQIVELENKTIEEIKEEQKNSDRMNDYELVRDDKGYLIWPLEDATKLPIYAHGKVRSSNKAKFSMRDYSWLDNRKKWYGIQISNDGKQFYGLDGGNESVRLEVEIEEGEQFVNFIRFQLAEWWAWVVPPIVVGFLTVIVSGIVYIIWNERYEKKKEVEHLKELELQKEKRKKDEEMSRLNKVSYDEDKDNHTMIITEEDEVKTQLPKVNLTESQTSIHFVSLRKNQQQTQSQNLPEPELESKSSSSLPIKQKSHLQINPRDDEQFADVVKVIDKVSQSSSQSEIIPSIQQQLETPKAWQEQLITESFESFPNLSRVPSHSSTTSLFMSTSQSSSLFQTNQSIIPQSSSSQSISKLMNLSSTNQNQLSKHFDRLELLLQTLENKQTVKEKQKHPLATCEYEQPTDPIQTSDTNINVKSKSKMKSQNNLNTKINKSISPLHKQNPQPHSSSKSKATFTGHLFDQEAPDIDFSLISSDSPELERVVWGPSGPPATLSLAKFDFDSADLIAYPQHWERIGFIKGKSQR